MTGNRIGAPAGTNRLYVSFYSPLALTGVTLDGEATGLAVGREEGWNVYSRLVDIPPGGTVTFELQLAGTVSQSRRAGHVGAADGVAARGGGLTRDSCSSRRIA